MLFWISQQIIISVILIILVHSIYKFLQNNLTTPKVKDMVTISNNKYRDIYKTINTDEGIKNCVNTASMKNELQSYLKELSTNEDIVSDNVFPASNAFTNIYETI
tara:strand:+ start:1013 stop:1327 length:315 start_codon:yes stop_codon:yes gene_type:complete